MKRTILIIALFTALIMNNFVQITDSECGQYTTYDREIFCIDRDTIVSLAFTDIEFRI